MPKTTNPNQDSISVKTTAMHFAYGQKSIVFEDNSLDISVPKNQPNKLYGIIGPSGTGKTTLINILGGQLKPTQGQVLINDVDIYTVDDFKRRELIGLQLQFATSLRGKLRYNMLFGLPTKEDGSQLYEDEILIKVLTQVGLWSLFKDKDGLETLIGEGGLNLSGGQRQRLNFAGLYLRAKYYKPVLLLIDEPTSSLDEISEKAITAMILEMASSALTLVVAHRIQTLDMATGLMDSSLFETEKQMQFHTTTQLHKISQYYRDLMVGKAFLDE